MSSLGTNTRGSKPLNQKRIEKEGHGRKKVNETCNLQ